MELDNKKESYEPLTGSNNAGGSQRCKAGLPQCATGRGQRGADWQPVGPDAAVELCWSPFASFCALDGEVRN